MKKKLWAVLLLGAFMLPFNTYAETEVTTDFTLSKDITDGIVVKKGSDVTINLGKYNVTNENGDDTIKIEEGAKATIIGNGKVTSNTKGKAVLANYGTVVVKGGNYSREETSTNGYYVFLNRGNATIDGGYFLISAPNFENGSSSLIDNGWYEESENKDNSIATMTINGGTFETKETNKYIKNDCFGEMVINGGTFNTNKIASAVVYNGPKSKSLVINGGVFNHIGRGQKSGRPTEPIWNDGGTAMINGGIYNLLNDEVAITDGGTLNFTVKKYKPIGASDDTTVSVDEKEIKDILDVKKMDSSTISKEDNELFNKAMGDKYKVAGFYDINLFKGLNDDLKFEEVLEASDKVKVTLSIPTALPQVAEGYKRTYYVIRLHNGKTDILDTTLTDDNKVSFETDKFSSYALAYVDEKVDNTTQIENPNTSDKALIYGVISLIGLSGLVYTAKVLKKRS